MFLNIKRDILSRDQHGGAGLELESTGQYFDHN